MAGAKNREPFWVAILSSNVSVSSLVLRVEMKARNTANRREVSWLVGLLIRRNPGHIVYARF